MRKGNQATSPSIPAVRVCFLPWWLSFTRPPFLSTPQVFLEPHVPTGCSHLDLPCVRVKAGPWIRSKPVTCYWNASPLFLWRIQFSFLRWQLQQVQALSRDSMWAALICWCVKMLLLWTPLDVLLLGVAISNSMGRCTAAGPISLLDREGDE
ncbi:hypothetical protein VIGAN_03171700, partial [Vigna angularis var. angularis]